MTDGRRFGPRPGSLLGRAVRAWRRHGALGFLRLCLSNLALLVSGKAPHDRYIYDESFDREFGTDTLGVVELDEMQIGAEAGEGAVRYEATDPACFRFLLERAFPDGEHPDTFVDLGCGKGRVLILAAEAGFRRIIGIELDPGLHAIAVRNIEKVRWRYPAAEFGILNGDATAMEFPTRAIVCYVNNPFGADAILRVVRNLEQSLRAHPRDCILIYLHAFHARIIQERARWEQIASGEYRSARTPFAIFRWRTAGPDADELPGTA